MTLRRWPAAARAALVCAALACGGSGARESDRLSAAGAGAVSAGAGGTAGGVGGAPAAGGSGAAPAAGGVGAAPAAGGGAGSAARAGSPSMPGAGGSAGSDAPMDAGEPDPAERGVRIDGRRLLVDGEPFQIQGVCWNPVDRGGVHPADLDYAGFVGKDAPLMQQAGINAVRTYSPLTDTAVLDALHSAGIYVLNAVYIYGGDDPSAVDGRVAAVKDHPAILMWVLGNEWNYNGLYVGQSHEQSLAALNEAAARIRELDERHPIATVYGEIPAADVVEAMPLVDVWGINAYRGLSFGDLFDRFADVSDKPMFLAEYGADAYDARQDAPNLSAQADATRALTEEILARSAARTPAGQCIGGTIFEWADEWWKDSGGSPDVQEPGGIAPGGGPHPDQTFNEEWWGVVDVDRNPRPAYDVLKQLYAAP